MNYKVMIASIVTLIIFFNATAMNESLKRKLNSEQSGKKVKTNNTDQRSNTNEFNDEMPGLEELPSNVITPQESTVPEIDMPGLKEGSAEESTQLKKDLKITVHEDTSSTKAKNLHIKKPTVIVEYNHHGTTLYFLGKEY